MPDSSWWLDSNELDDEQQDVVGLPVQGSYIVVGPPGSGKTNLLLLRGSYLTLSGLPNVLVLMFTRSLRDFVARGSKNYQFSSDKIKTILGWERSLLSEYGISIDRNNRSFSDIRHAHVKSLLEVVNKNPGLENHLDCILVDEVQDCLEDEITLFRRLAKNVFFAGDHRQKIYEGPDIIEGLGPDVIKKTLTKHYRNGEAICRAADEIGRTSGQYPLLNTCNYKEKNAKSSVEFENCKSEAEMLSKLESRLVQQLKAYPKELLGVACLRNEDVEVIRQSLLANSQISDFVCGSDGPVSDEEQIYVCTMHDAKGLEFRALHLPFADSIVKARGAQKRLAFTGVTRAKTSLVVYHTSSLPGYLEKARESVLPPKGRPSLDLLFAGKKKK